MTKVKSATTHFVNEPSNRTRTGATVRLHSLMEEAQKLAIGQRIRELRERSPYKQPAVAERLGIGLRAYQKLEEVGTTRYERCEELAEIFGADPMWIWEGRERGSTPDLFGERDQLAALNRKLDRILEHLGIAEVSELDEALAELDDAADHGEEASEPGSPPGGSPGDASANP